MQRVVFVLFNISLSLRQKQKKICSTTYRVKEAAARDDAEIAAFLQTHRTSNVLFFGSYNHDM